MKNTILKIEKLLNAPIEKVVNPTILGNCIYLNKRNMFDFSKGKYLQEQYGNWQLLQTLSQSSKDNLTSKEVKGLQLRVRIFLNSDISCKPIADELCAVSKAKQSYTIVWNQKMKLALQSLFPVSTAIAISCGSGTKINMNSPLAETICISPFTEVNGNGGWNIYPNKRAKDEIQDNTYNSEYQLMLSVLKDYSKDLYLNTSKKRESSRNHANAFSTSSTWKDAAEFKGSITARQNCIYTLVSDPDKDGKCSIYVGEAVSSGGRLKQFLIDDKYYIDHTKDKAKIHQFTRFRIDELKPEAYEFLHDAQDSIIGALWMLNQECPNGYTMTNDKLCRAISEAYTADMIIRNK